MLIRRVLCRRSGWNRNSGNCSIGCYRHKTTLFVGAMFGQERFGQLEGVATDPSGAVLPNVAVKVTNKASLRVVETTTSGAGEWGLIRSMASNANSATTAMVKVIREVSGT